MSSGGSRWPGRTDPEDLRERLRQAESRTKDDVFETQVADEIAVTLADYNNRDTEVIGRVLESVKAELGEEFEMTIDLRFGGSVSKKTYVNGLSDVDALVLIHRDDVAGKSPDQIRTIFAERLRARFGRDAVREGQLAVTLTLNDQEIQLVPAISQDDQVKIASSSVKNWSSIRPRVFSELLTGANKQMDGKLVPTIKLAKGIIAGLPDQRQLTGYHTEVLAVAIFKDYAGPKTPKAMLRHLFDKLPDAVRQPRRDVTGQSVYLDDYLGERDSLQRRIVADAMERIARRIRNADGAHSIPLWRELLRGD